MFESLDESWSGIYVYNSHKNSSLNNVIIKNTKGINEELLNLSGGVVFYNSNVNLNYVTFDYTEAEDALNIVDLLKEKNISLILNRVHRLPDSQDSPIDEPFTQAKKLKEVGILFTTDGYLTKNSLYMNWLINTVFLLKG